MNKRQLRIFLSDSNDKWLSREMSNTGLTATQVMNKAIHYAIKAKEMRDEEETAGCLD